MSLDRLKNKVAIITGGAKGIGRAIAQKFAQEGATIIIWDIDEDAGELTTLELLEAQHEAEFFLVDTSKLYAVEYAAQQVISNYKKIDILINNAAILRDATLLKMTGAAWQEVIDVNLTGVFHCTKTVASYMVKQRYGRIINATSIVGGQGNFGQTNYVASKAGVIGMTKVWSKELGSKGITVNAVAPGFIQTEMTNKLPGKVLKTLLDKTPLHRMGTPEEVASAYLFLASDEAAFINGAVLNVDGGLTI